jgi:hypothetical protein
MPENPFLSDAMANASAGLQAARALRAATAQQQQQQDADRQRQFDAELKLRQDGYTPHQPYVDTTPAGQQGGLRTRQANPNAPDKSGVITDPWGRQWSKQPDTGKGQTDLREALNQGGQTVTPNGQLMDPTLADVPRLREDLNGNQTPTGQYGTTMPVPDDNRVINAGGKKVYMPTEEEKKAAGLRAELKAISAKNDAEGWIMPDSLADQLATKAGLPAGSLHGQKIPHEAVATAQANSSRPTSPPSTRMGTTATLRAALRSRA